jgi:hypothetical protein
VKSPRRKITPDVRTLANEINALFALRIQKQQTQEIVEWFVLLLSD